ncbi:MAG: type IV pili twitching motility protein PilT, partial [Myxococcota bacterium]
MARIDDLFRYMHQNDASDLHLSAGMEPRVRRKGSLHAVDGWPVLGDGDIRAMLQEITTPTQWQEYDSGGDLDFAYGLSGVARFRANYLRQQRGAGAVFRIIPEEIIPLEKLNLPAAIGNLTELQQGLVLVT